MPVKFSWTENSVGYTYTIYAEEMSTEMKSKKIRQPIPGSNDLLVDLGREGPDIRLSFYAPTTGDYGTLEHLYASATLTVDTSGVTGPYPEFPNASVWYVEKISFKRLPGYVTSRLVDLTLNRKW